MGYRSGQLVLLEYRDRTARVKQRFNKGLKGEGFFSRASSAFFGSEEAYLPYFKEPVRRLAVHSDAPSLNHAYQVGNALVLQQEMSESK